MNNLKKIFYLLINGIYLFFILVISFCSNRAFNYYWNKYYHKNNIDKHFEMHLPKEEALKFISEDEYNMLLELSTK